MTYYYRLTIFLILALTVELIETQLGLTIILPVAIWLILESEKQDVSKAFIFTITILSIVWGIFYGTNWGFLIVWFLALLAIHKLLAKFVSNDLALTVIMLVVGIFSYVIVFNIYFNIVSLMLLVLLSVPIVILCKRFLDDSDLFTRDHRYRI